MYVVGGVSFGYLYRCEIEPQLRVRKSIKQKFSFEKHQALSIKRKDYWYMSNIFMRLENRIIMKFVLLSFLSSYSWNYFKFVSSFLCWYTLPVAFSFVDFRRRKITIVNCQMCVCVLCVCEFEHPPQYPVGSKEMIYFVHSISLRVFIHLSEFMATSAHTLPYALCVNVHYMFVWFWGSKMRWVH